MVGFVEATSLKETADPPYKWVASLLQSLQMGMSSPSPCPFTWQVLPVSPFAHVDEFIVISFPMGVVVEGYSSVLLGSFAAHKLLAALARDLQEPGARAAQQG